MARETGEVERNPRLTYEIPEAGAMLGLSKSASYTAADRGELGEVIQIGRRKVLLKTSFQRKFKLQTTD